MVNNFTNIIQQKRTTITHLKHTYIAYEYLLKIAALVKDYPSCRITILEIPVYSIKNWNQRKGHKNLDEFIEQDKKLETQVYNLNGKIRQINETTKHTLRTSVPTL